MEDLSQKQMLEEQFASQQRNLSYMMQDMANDFYQENYAPNLNININNQSYTQIKIQDEQEEQNDKRSPEIQRRNSYLNEDAFNLNKKIESPRLEYDQEEDDGDENVEESDDEPFIEQKIKMYKKKTRTRKRSYDMDDDNSQDESYFSISREAQYKSKNFLKTRDMNDIKNDSLKTSFHINEKSFKWSTQINHPTVTQRKGNVSKNYKMDVNKLQNKEKTEKMFFNKAKETDSNILFHRSIQQSLNENQNIFKNISKYSNALTMFLQKFMIQKKENMNKIEFYHYEKLDKGSFGQVDLYFFEIDQYDLCNFQSKYENQQSNYFINRENNNQYNQNSYIFSSQNSSQSNQSQSTNQDTLQQNNINNSQTSQGSTYQGSTQLYSTSKKQIIGNNNISSHLVDQKNQNLNYQVNIQLNSKNYLPAAGKKIKIKYEFIRELFIMQKVQSEYMPSLLGQDIEQQILFIELGLCSLYDLKMYSEKQNYKISDNLAYSILINLFQAIESLLQNFDQQENKILPLFHSDIKPQNIILTVKNSKENIPQIQLLLIDFGGASFQAEDYWSYFTPAFVCPKLWEKLVNSKSQKEFLTWPEIRYAELYAACRSVQFLILNQNDQNLFKKENSQDFIQSYQKLYPKTCKILEEVYLKNTNCQVMKGYSNILNEDEISSQNQIYPQPIYFETQKLFEISKFYNIINNNSSKQ
ncbi:hypothetical protein TTHERM_00085370 (macronuclear) [Tetrahymena thermophila SB210]|uniref:Protein kinase domain-containing protein n=1 Tax=Tetrahymena thermophila (strain SB210) TaxID=312017 RepID=Q236R1_TETTS|nr:hypothetical protein TTHERM_00085370 [Tetrahymena thermophila SB210]EAR92439.2 hypothetical protein TTHERM_00085370 [Tetrahymena thermophila SB210]|eukprot:XP_001012684.2 hypothetical protein TTHERM_00085370 [Tetrahymena thermophila SB210]